MKKFFTLLLGAVTASLFSTIPAQAQITLNGRIDTAEVGPGNYQLIGTYNAESTGFGKWGMVRLYAGTVGEKLHIGIVGAVETNGNTFQIYINTPRRTGIASGTALPSGAANTGFENNNAIMEMEVDYAISVRGGQTLAVQAMDYTANPAETIMLDTLAPTGAMMTHTTTNAVFGGSRMAFVNMDSLNRDQVQGWEIELDTAKLGIQAGDTIQLFAAMNNNTGGYYSANVIPEVTDRNGANLEANPDFTQLPGTQFINYTLGSTVTSTRPLVSNTFASMAYPNPFTASVTISYNLTKADRVTVKVFDITGKEVTTLYDGKQQAGTHAIEWNGTHHNMTPAQSGSYFIRIQSSDAVGIRKLLLTR